jgi:hypothetical protein
LSTPARILVFPEILIDNLAKRIVVSPRHVFDLDDEFWANPVHLASLSDRALLGKVDQSLRNDPAGSLDPASTQDVPEQFDHRRDEGRELWSSRCTRTQARPLMHQTINANA